MNSFIIEIAPIGTVELRPVYSGFLLTRSHFEIELSRIDKMVTEPNC